MLKLKEGFKGERLISLPEDLLETYSKDPMIKNLYIRKMGFFPRVKYHYIQKGTGADYAMLIYCTDGEGWYKIHDKVYPVIANTYIIIPPNTPYSFGADDDNPWSIYFIHFKGDMCKHFIPQCPVPQSIAPSEHSRIQERLALFEEISQCFSMGYIKEYMTFSSLSLYRLLGSFIYLEQYRHINTLDNKDSSLSAKVIHYMQENIYRDVTLVELAEKFKYSASHFSTLFTRETGVSPISYFIRLKIQKACQHIEMSDMKMNEISSLMGFEEPAYFSRQFTKIMGVPPLVYRKKESLRKQIAETNNLKYRDDNQE